MVRVRNISLTGYLIRNTEAISVVQALVASSPDIQKILAFQGAFEKLFNTIRQEGGVEGGAVAHEALACVDTLLRFNSSNQVSPHYDQVFLLTLI